MLTATMAPLIGFCLRACLEHVEEGHPLVAVVGLGGVAAGGVEEDALVGEPPVAVARAADAAHARRRCAHVREDEAGLLERRRLARAGRADDHVPGKLVEGALSQARRLERLDGLVKLGLDGLHLGPLVRPGARHLVQSLVFQLLLDERRAAHLHGFLEDKEDDRQEQHRRDRDEPDLLFDMELLSSEPDQEQDDDQDQDQGQGALGERGEYLHAECPLVISGG